MNKFLTKSKVLEKIDGIIYENSDVFGLSFHAQS